MGVALEQVGEEREPPDDHGEDQVGMEMGDDPGGVVEAEVDRDERVDHRADATDRPAGEADVESVEASVQWYREPQTSMVIE